MFNSALVKEDTNFFKNPLVKTIRHFLQGTIQDIIKLYNKITEPGNPMC